LRGNLCYEITPPIHDAPFKEDFMRKIIWVLSLALLATASPALAQTGGACPEDVAAAVAAACPCGADAQGQSWKNHGQYVRCVVRFRNDLRKQGCLDDAAKRTIARCAARSTCGKEGAVLCCFYDTSGTCSDAAPGDGTAAGVCSNDDTITCDVNADCITAKGPKVVKGDTRCIERGGTPIGTGSVCSGCPIPPPAP
jgi:hypothetical protein